MASIKNKRVVFTGKLASISRTQAWEAVRKAGGEPEKEVTRGTDILVIGMEGWLLLPDGSVSRKLLHAEKLQAQGCPIRIISEAEFLEIVGLRDCQPQTSKNYSASEVCRILDIPRETLARWEHFGLIRPIDGRYDFQDLISARAVTGLVAKGVQPATIAKSLQALPSIIPVERPLAQLKIVTESPPALLIQLGDCRIAPNGQLVLDLNRGSPTGGSIVALKRQKSRASETMRSAEDWFRIGEVYEQEACYPDAAAAYRRAIGLHPGYASAFFNLGNVMRAMGNLSGAEEAYRAAVSCDRCLACAWYNLAYVQDDTGRVAEAIESLKQAVAISPSYADAHFNLAFCYERVGRRTDARHHWTLYIQLDSDSEWARIARRHIDLTLF